ncbi:hypothetical protein [Streptomyces sp. ISL-87]|uniref:hypothetical protein n=1 Tax=unclassified Streptomyces TaxID=2593676 RepID=UPI0035ABE466
MGLSARGGKAAVTARLAAALDGCRRPRRTRRRRRPPAAPAGGSRPRRRRHRDPAGAVVQPGAPRVLRAGDRASVPLRRLHA